MSITTKLLLKIETFDIDTKNVCFVIWDQT